MLDSLFNKVAGLFIKKKLQHKCSPVNFVKFLRTTILKNSCERLLLKKKNSEIVEKQQITEETVVYSDVAEERSWSKNIEICVIFQCNKDIPKHLRFCIRCQNTSAVVHCLKWW